MLNGRCVAECPQESFYRGKSGRHEACIPCYYTCKTCSGSNDYEVQGPCGGTIPIQTIYSSPETYLQII